MYSPRQNVSHSEVGLYVYCSNRLSLAAFRATMKFGGPATTEVLVLVLLRRLDGPAEYTSVEAAAEEVYVGRYVIRPGH